MKSNRDGIGAVVRVESRGGRQWQMVRSGSSYASQSELTLTFGLGGDPSASIRVEWPSGTVDVLNDVKAGQRLLIEEGRNKQ